MSKPVKTSIRDVQTAQTESRVLAAATDLFVANGYLATTLADVADRAGVGARTVYVRFGTKAALFARVVDVAVAGDTAPVALFDRPATQGPFSGPDPMARLVEFCRITAQIMRRTGDLFAVAQEAAMIDPVLQQNWQAGREGTRHNHDLFWRALAADGLLAADLDLTWLVDTATIVGGAETYLLGRHLKRWTIPAYQRWLVATCARLAGLDRP